MRTIRETRLLGIGVMMVGMVALLAGCETMGSMGQTSSHGSMGMGGSGGMMAMSKDRVMAKSQYPFDETVSRIKQTIESKQMMVVFTADHQAMLRMVGLNPRGMVGIEFFHPRYGKVVAQNDPRAGIEMPLRLVVMETEDGKAMLSYYRPSSIFAPYKGLSGLGRELDGVLEAIVNAVSS